MSDQKEVVVTQELIYKKLSHIETKMDVVNEYVNLHDSKMDKKYKEINTLITKLKDETITNKKMRGYLFNFGVLMIVAMILIIGVGINLANHPELMPKPPTTTSSK